MLDPTKGLSGDIIYGNSSSEILEWKQLINACRLRILIHLSKKESDADLNIKQQFQNIVINSNEYPLMSSNDDNAQLVFNTSAESNYYPTYLSNDLRTGAVMEQGFVDTLLAKNDPRLFSFANPLNGQPANVFSSYNGLNTAIQSQFSGTDDMNGVMWLLK
ncbi:MAG TPA: SusD/RagB family nutrient-binding outer membrane lipoprotein [Puia sp.]|nr:SusD/RagB family nutrient-binding outer membrane lipoprotein [Puia sp.]